MNQKLRYKRVLLKLSGEILRGSATGFIDLSILKILSDEINNVCKLGVQIGIVIGAGNIIRGLSANSIGLDRVTGDYMGMLATVLNSLALQDILKKTGLRVRVVSAIPMQGVCEPYIKERVINCFLKGGVVIFSAGMGHPYFTTDTAACLRAMEMGAEVVLKGTKVDGIYDKDPLFFKKSIRFDRLGYMDILNRGIKVMDFTAISLCMDNFLKIHVFNILKKGDLVKIIMGHNVGTLVS